MDEIEHSQSEGAIYSRRYMAATSYSPQISVGDADEDSHFDGDIIDSDVDLVEWLANNFPEKTVIAEEENDSNMGKPLRTGGWLNDSIHVNSEGTSRRAETVSSHTSTPATLRCNVTGEHSDVVDFSLSFL